MDCWTGVLKVSLSHGSTSCYRVAVSLCLSTSKTLSFLLQIIFLHGDRVDGTKNPVIERLSDLQNIAQILVSKFGGSVNAWVIEASSFNGPFAAYRDFIPSVNQWGEPISYSPAGFPASASTISLSSNCLGEVRNLISRQKKQSLSDVIYAPSFYQPETYILGFSKGGTVLNQLVTELGFSEIKFHMKKQPNSEEASNVQEEIQIIPSTNVDILNSITETHYVDVSLNSTGAYITGHIVIERISKRLVQGTPGVRFVLRGTPRQWCDGRRALIRNEKDKLLHLLESEAQRSGGKLQGCEKFYFADRPPDLQIHFERIENMDAR